jgi:hypothetical protein
MSRVDIADERDQEGWSRATCEADGCNATIEGRPADGWPESEGWAVKWDYDSPVISTGSAHDYCPEHAHIATT